MKEKFSTWYYAMIIVFSLLIVGIKVMGANAKSIITNAHCDIIGLSYINPTIPILFFLPIVTLFIGTIFKFLGRKKFRISKFFILATIIIETLSYCNIIRYGYFPYLGLNKFGISITAFIIISNIFLLIVNPKWHIDSSSKLVMNKENKEKRQELNNKIIREFKEKEEKIINKKYYISFAIIVMIASLISIYQISPIKNSVDKNENMDQLEITGDTAIYKKSDFHFPYGYVQENDFVDILETIKDENGLVKSYKVKNGKNVLGYIKNDKAKLIYGKNSEFYGKTQSNERNEKVFQVRVISETIRIRTEPGGKEIGTVNKGEIYTVEEEKVPNPNDSNSTIYYKIKTSLGITGYIADRYKDDIYLEKLYTDEQKRAIQEYNEAMESIEGTWHWNNRSNYYMELKNGKMSIGNRNGYWQENAYSYKYNTEKKTYDLNWSGKYLTFDGQKIRMMEKNGEETTLTAFENYATRE